MWASLFKHTVSCDRDSRLYLPRPLQKAFRLVVAALFMSIASAGCGGGLSESDSSTSTIRAQDPATVPISIGLLEPGHWQELPDTKISHLLSPQQQLGAMANAAPSVVRAK